MAVSNLVPRGPLLGALLGLLAAGCNPPAVDYLGKTCDTQDDCGSDLVCDPATKTCQKTAGTPDASAAGLDAATPHVDAGAGLDAGPSGDGGTVGDGGHVKRTATCVTAGGGALSSASYRLQVYAAPTTPVGALSSTNYRLQLGPAAASR